FNPVVKLCIQGMALEDSGKPDEASIIFLQAWNEAMTDFEKFTAAHYVARHQKSGADTLKWLDISLQLALNINDSSVNSALPALHTKIAKIHEESGDLEKAKRHYELAKAANMNITDTGPFYHGTRADLEIGDLLIPGNKSNYVSD